MPARFERYNRMMKYAIPGWSNDKQLDEGNGWLECDWLSTCEVCKKQFPRNTMKLKGGLVRCEECLKAYVI